MTDGAPWLLGYGAAVAAASGWLRRAALARRRCGSSPDRLTGELWTSIADVGTWLGLVMMLAASGWLPLPAVLLLAGAGLALLAAIRGQPPGSR